MLFIQGIHGAILVTAPQVVYLSWSKPQKKITQAIPNSAWIQKKGRLFRFIKFRPSRTSGAALDDPHEERSKHKNVAQDWSMAAPQLRDTCQQRQPCWGDTLSCSAVWHSAHTLRSSLLGGRDCQRSLKARQMPALLLLLSQTQPSRWHVYLLAHTPIPGNKH